jgi:hypothetical protein
MAWVAKRRRRVVRPTPDTAQTLAGQTPCRSAPARQTSGRARRSRALRLHAIMTAIDQYAEFETGNFEYFWNKPHGIG